MTRTETWSGNRLPQQPNGEAARPSAGTKFAAKKLSVRLFEDYWQDGPGQQSTQLNLELQDAGVINIERTAIIADHLWPPDQLFPVKPLHSWLDQQHRYGIWVRLVRESTLSNDTDLLCDFGIYGSRAVGIQIADPAGRTIRFILDFNFDKVQQAELKWSRLAVYATSYRDLLDQQH